MTRAKGADQIRPKKLRDVAPPPPTGFFPAEAGGRYEASPLDKEGKCRDPEDSVKWDEV